MTQIDIRQIPFQDVPWAALDAYADRTVFQTREWLAFVAETQGARPVVAEVRRGREPIGYLSGLIVRKFGAKIFGSSFPGWTTPYIGFNLLAPTDGRGLLSALKSFVFDELGCLHFEVSGRNLPVDAAESLGYRLDAFRTFDSDLRPSEEQILGSMIKSCRYSIRKAEKGGLTIEETPPDDRFAEEYYDQLRDVFAKQQLVPTYGIERVHALLHHLGPTGRLLLLRARDPEGRCVATGLYVGFKRVAEFWGNASYRWGQSLCPNEALHWYAMRYWKARGAEVFDWGGIAKYKLKYGGTPIEVPWLKCSRYAWLEGVRTGAKRLVDLKQRTAGRLKGLSAPAAPASPSSDADE